MNDYIDKYLFTINVDSQPFSFAYSSKILFRRYSFFPSRRHFTLLKWKINQWVVLWKRWKTFYGGKYKNIVNTSFYVLILTNNFWYHKNIFRHIFLRNIGKQFSIKVKDKKWYLDLPFHVFSTHFFFIFYGDDGKKSKVNECLHNFHISSSAINWKFENFSREFTKRFNDTNWYNSD